MSQATESMNAATGPGRTLTGTTVGGRFRIEALLANEGGTTLYRAADTQATSPVLLRIIPQPAVAGTLAELIASVGRLQSLRHKNLVDLEAVGQEGDLAYVASELVDGQTLREFIDTKRAEGRTVSLKGASNLVAHVANALDYARRVTVHGALNPGLISVNRAGRVKVSGLGLFPFVPGLARFGAPSGSVMTAYVAPEVLGGAQASATSDVYSLGVILYELLTGNLPGKPLTPASTVAAEVPAAIDMVIERALRAAPDARWPSPTAMKEALQAAAGLVPSPTESPASRAAAPAGAAGGLPVSSPVAPSAVASAGASSRAPEVRGRPANPLAIPVGGGPDEQVEKWLVHKDRLDFGPFSMIQLRAQIERGEVLPDHRLIDNETGTNLKVKEYPGLADLAKHAHRRLEQARRAKAEQQSARSEKKKSFATKMIVGLVLAAVLGAVAIYVLSRRDTSGGRLASREEEAEIETFLKGVKLSGLKGSVKRGGGGGHRAAGATSAGSAEDFANDSNFGDASKGFNAGDQTLDDDQIQNTMMANYRKLIPCIAHGGVNEIAMEFVVRGNGKVSAVKVNGQRAGTLPACLLARMQSFNFPKFDGSKTIASWSMSMGR